MKTLATQFDPTAVEPLRQALGAHPVYGRVRTLGDLRVFMEHHVFPVWDFMSLLKFLQQAVAPTTYPWRPRGSAAVRHFVNQLALAEESDHGLPTAEGATTYASHFELYCDAMREVGADPSKAIRFCEVAADQGLDAALALDLAPPPSRRFVQRTFDFLATGKPHVVAAAFALGREHIIPEMFRAFLAKTGISRNEAPTFHYYLDRHIELDGDIHAPLSLRLLHELTGTDPVHLREAETAARDAMTARLQLWDGVVEAMEGAS